MRYGSVPSNTQSGFDYQINGEGAIRIVPGDKAYHREGYFYILVLPDFGFFDLFVDNYYTFTVSWRQENTLPHLNAQALQFVVTPSYGFTYLRHYVQDTSEDIRISLLAKSGH